MALILSPRSGGLVISLGLATLMLTGCAATTPVTGVVDAPSATETPVAETSSEAAEAAKMLEDLINSSLAANNDEIMSNRILVTPDTTSAEYGDINARMVALIPELKSVIVNFEQGANPDKANQGTYFEYSTFLRLSQLANGTDVSVTIPEAAVTVDGISAKARPADFIFSGTDAPSVSAVKEALQTTQEFALTSYYEDKWTLLVAAMTITE